MVFSLLISAAGVPADATDFTAGAVTKKMEPEKRYSYIAGVVEGIAYARFARDDKKPAGMECIYDWFYKNAGTFDTLYAAFEKYPTFTPGAIVATLAKRKCGE